MKKLLWRSFLVSLAAWCILAWPLPRHLTSGILAGTTKDQPVVEKVMRPGDHLQLLYRFRLVKHFLTGRLPWMENRYEFNTGNDTARREPPGDHYAPFSLMSAAGALVTGSDAFGYNLAGFIALWMTYLGTYLLARRFTLSSVLAATAALVSITFPYRWINIAAGSPTGFAMMWVPWLLWGLDRAVRDRSWIGGGIAGMAFVMAACGDIHVFFFCALLAAGWCLICWILSDTVSLSWRAWFRAMLIALLPAVVGAAIGYYAVRAMTVDTRPAPGVANAEAKGRDWDEIAQHSPLGRGLLGLEVPEAFSDKSAHIYVGFSIAVALLLAALGLLGPQTARARWALILLLAGIGALGILALGPHGPFFPYFGNQYNGVFFHAAQKLIPGYNLIRQPAKIFCLLPSLLAVTLVYAAQIARRKWIGPMMGLVMLGAVVEFTARFNVDVCPLRNQQAAYAAVMEAQTERPAAIVLPLWPGDAAQASLYQHYASIHGLPIINGYRPFPPRGYFTNVFKRLEAMNQGVIDDEALDALARFKINAIILHQDQFPDKVSPYPASQTLRALLNHPRLRLLQQDGPVWAFKIEPVPVQRQAVATNWNYAMSPLLFHGKSLQRILPGPPTNHQPCLVYQPGLRWLVRSSGTGSLTLASITRGTEYSATTQVFNSAAARWSTAMIPPFDGIATNQLRMDTDGGVRVESAQLVTAEWPKLKPHEFIDIPAACFCGSGASDPTDGSVQLRAGKDAPGRVLYGPRLPIGAGRFTATLVVQPSVTNRVPAGKWTAELPKHSISRDFSAGESPTVTFTIQDDESLMLKLEYHSDVDLRVAFIRLERLPDTAR